jgi:hypothetical protein
VPNSPTKAIHTKTIAYSAYYYKFGTRDRIPEKYNFLNPPSLLRGLPAELGSIF